MPDDVMALSGESDAPIPPGGCAHPTESAELEAGAEPRPRGCPRCGRPLVRVRRRLIDRLLSMTAPVHRYRCHAIECCWTGNLPPRGRWNAAPGTDDSGSSSDTGSG
jgi:hypothetical protein